MIVVVLVARLCRSLVTWLRSAVLTHSSGSRGRRGQGRAVQVASVPWACLNEAGARQVSASLFILSRLPVIIQKTNLITSLSCSRSLGDSLGTDFQTFFFFNEVKPFFKQNLTVLTWRAGVSGTFYCIRV